MRTARESFDIAKGLDDAGELEEELKALVTILEVSKFTRAQVIDYFEGIIGPIYFMATMGLGRDPTIEEYRADIREYFTDRTHLIEDCMHFMDIDAKPEIEMLLDSLRIMENYDWLHSLEENEKKPPSEPKND